MLNGALGDFRHQFRDVIDPINDVLQRPTGLADQIHSTLHQYGAVTDQRFDLHGRIRGPLCHQGPYFRSDDREAAPRFACSGGLYPGVGGAGFFGDEQWITCPIGAPYMLPVLEKLVNSAETDIFLPSQAPSFRQATLIDSAMWQLRSVATLGKETIPGISNWYLLLFGSFALMLDSLAALTAHMAGRKLGAQLSEQEWADLEGHHAAMEDFIWATPGSYIKNRSGNVIDYDPSIVMIMPTEAADKASRDLIGLLQGFTAAYGLTIDTTRAARSLSDLPFEYQHLKRRMQRRSFTGDLFDIYRGDPSDWELIFEHQRVLRLIFSQGAKMPKHRYKIKSRTNNVTPLRAKI